MKLNDERRWLLRRFNVSPGWGVNLQTGKKWERHAAMLVKGGLLEQSGEGRATMYRVTDAGRAALAAE